MTHSLILVVFFINLFHFISSVPYTFNLVNDKNGKTVVADGTKGI